MSDPIDEAALVQSASQGASQGVYSPQGGGQCAYSPQEGGQSVYSLQEGAYSHQEGGQPYGYSPVERLMERLTEGFMESLTAFRREAAATRREASPMGTVPWRDSWSVSQRDSWGGSRTTAAGETLQASLRSSRVVSSRVAMSKYIEYRRVCRQCQSTLSTGGSAGSVKSTQSAPPVGSLEVGQYKETI